MLLDQILEDCFLLALDVDYAQNYGHISQVALFTTEDGCVLTSLTCHVIHLQKTTAHEPVTMVS